MLCCVRCVLRSTELVFYGIFYITAAFPSVKNISKPGAYNVRTPFWKTCWITLKPDQIVSSLEQINVLHLHFLKQITKDLLQKLMQTHWKPSQRLHYPWTHNPQTAFTNEGGVSAVMILHTLIRSDWLTGNVQHDTICKKCSRINFKKKNIINKCLHDAYSFFCLTFQNNIVRKWSIVILYNYVLMWTRICIARLKLFL